MGHKKAFSIISLFFLFILFQNFGFVSSYENTELASNKPTLNDIFLGQARFQTIEESEEVKLNFNVNDGKGQHIFDQKLSVLYDKKSRQYFTFTRAMVTSTKKFKTIALVSSDGKNFKQKGVLFPYLYENPADQWTVYDAHIAFNGQKYIMTAECANRGIGASVCISETKTPFDISSWSRPKLIVRNSDSPRHSASTGVTVQFKGETYLTWTVVDDSRTTYTRFEDGVRIINSEDGDESAFSKAIKLHKNLNGDYIYAGKSADIGKVVLGAEKNPYCNSAWDCNNADVQDWKIENNKVYAIYNGSNYYRCSRPNKELNLDNTWNIAIKRSNHPLGDYSDSSGVLIQSAVSTICGISYPVLNKVGGETYLYYTYYTYIDGDRNKRVNKMMRSKLVKGKPLQISRDTKDQKAKIAKVDHKYDGLTDKIENLYVKFLDRYPTNKELGHWINQSLSRGYKFTVRSVMLSKEHRGIWIKRNPNHKITSLYQGVLERQPDSGGMSHHKNLLINGGKSLEHFANAFVNSREFTNKNR
jgi:predicted GH43/DUF377 family glycosyl hydrolase